MGSRRRLIAALDGFVRHRQRGAKSKRHIVPLVEFAAAELRSRGVRGTSIVYEAAAGRFYQRQVDLVVKANNQISLTLVVISQSGSVRKNLNNRRREIVGDAVNLRAANPDALVALIYLLRADEEATNKGKSGASPFDELVAFLRDLQTANSPLGQPLLDAAALLAIDREESGRIRIEPMPPEVDILQGFFDHLACHLVIALLSGLADQLTLPHEFVPVHFAALVDRH